MKRLIKAARSYAQTAMVTVACCFGLQSLVCADQARPPVLEHWSANKQFCLFVTWNWNWKASPELKLKRKTLNGFALIWKLTCPYKVPPNRAHVSDDGHYVVLEDEWASVGRGVVLAFINSTGRVIATYRLHEIFSGDERSKFLDTVSNTWWSGWAIFFFRYPQHQFGFITAEGAIHPFDLDTGKPIVASPAIAQEIRNERIPAVRQALRKAKGMDRQSTIRQISQLNDRASIPDLIHLMLKDPTIERTTVAKDPDVKNGTYREYPIRWEAGRALVQLMGQDAIPHIAERIDECDAKELTGWAWLIAEAGGPKARTFLTEYRKRTGKWIGSEAIMELSKHDDGSFARSNPDLFSDRRDYIRTAVFYDIAEHPVKEDVPILRKSLNSSDDASKTWALRGLIRLQPAGLDVVLKRIAHGHDKFMAMVAQEGLAELGDKAAISKMLEMVAELGKHMKKDHMKFHDISYGCFIMIANTNMDDVLQSLIERRPPELAQALLKASRSDCEAVRVSVFGAMAALGDRKALSYVRTEAAKPTRRMNKFEQDDAVSHRSTAILWLGLARDQESIPLIRSGTTDPESVIREASRKSLVKIGN